AGREGAGAEARRGGARREGGGLLALGLGGGRGGGPRARRCGGPLRGGASGRELEDAEALAADELAALVRVARHPGDEVAPAQRRRLALGERLEDGRRLDPIARP